MGKAQLAVRFRVLREWATRSGGRYNVSKMINFSRLTGEKYTELMGMLTPAE